MVQEEFLHGAVAIAGLMLALAGIYWVVTGINPWPVFVLSELPGAGFGLVLLALLSPSRHR
jgi:drug/metabolite transporter (DMT)-like permease